MKVKEVKLSKRALKVLKRAPSYLAESLYEWMNSVKENGLSETRKIKGYHDEPLQGELWGLRSIRLNKGWRAYYKVVSDEVVFILVERIDKHEY